MCWKFILYGESMIRIRICGSRNRHLVCPVCTQRSPCNVALTYRWEKERKNEMICAYHLYPFFFFHFFLRFELQTAVFFRCVSVYVLCVCEICWINLMHARNGLVLLVCEGTFHGNERGFFFGWIRIQRVPNCSVSTLSAINVDGDRETESESYLRVLILFLSFNQMVLMSMHSCFETLKSLRKLFAHSIWKRKNLFKALRNQWVAHLLCPIFR